MPQRTTLLSWTAVAALLLLGLGLSHHPMLSSGFELVHGDPGDARLVHFLLEHERRWLVGEPAHANLLDPPFYFPARGLLLHSDTMLSIMPLYALLRALGLTAEPAFQGFYLLLSLLNFLAGFALFRLALRQGRVAAAAAAFVLSFGVSRAAQLNHVQLWPHFLVTLALTALVLLLQTEPGRATRRRRAALVGLLCAALVAQLYGTFYALFFFGLALAAALAVGLALPDTRPALLRALRGNALLLCGGAALAAAASWPLVRGYLDVHAHAGARSWEELLPMLPRPQSWLYVSPQSWWYGWMSRRPLFAELPVPEEQAVGMGLVTTGVLIWVLIAARRLPAARIMGAVSLALVGVATLWPGEISAWRAVHALVPGADAVRAVSRVGLLLLYPAAWAAAQLVERTAQQRGRSRVAGVVLLLLLLLEQGSSPRAFAWQPVRERVTAISALVPQSAHAFLWAPPSSTGAMTWDHIDAMWAALQTGVPTVNGYSGLCPPGWQRLLWARLRQPAFDGPRLWRGLEQWGAVSGLDVSRVAWLPRAPASRALAPPLGVRLDVRQRAAEAIFGRGWSRDDEGRWWLEGSEGELVFARPPALPSSASLRVTLGVGTVDSLPAALEVQLLHLGEQRWRGELATGERREIAISLPPEAPGAETRLVLRRGASSERTPAAGDTGTPGIGLTSIAFAVDAAGGP